MCTPYQTTTPELKSQMPIPTVAYLDIYTGDADQHARDEQAYVRTQTILSKNAMIYGLPSNPEDLSGEQQQILRELDVHMSLPPLFSQQYPHLTTWSFLCRNPMRHHFALHPLPRFSLADLSSHSIPLCQKHPPTSQRYVQVKRVHARMPRKRGCITLGVLYIGS